MGSLPIHLRTDRPRNPAYLTAVNSIGDHIRTVRLDRGLSQPDVAELIGVKPDSIVLWELNKVRPGVRHTPTILQFLGYNPLWNEPTSLGEWLLLYRAERGWTQERLAAELEIDQGTLAKLEKNRSKRKSKAVREKVTRLLAG